MMSVEGHYGLRQFGYFHIVFVDGKGVNTFFHMPSSKSFKSGKKVFFKDYISLYDSVKEIMVDGFSDCRWNNFDNVGEIIKECGDCEGGVFFNEGLFYYYFFIIVLVNSSLFFFSFSVLHWLLLTKIGSMALTTIKRIPCGLVGRKK